MKDFLLNDDWDLDRSTGDLCAVSGSTEAAQNINIGLLTIRGEYIFDVVSIGIPWLDGMLGSGWLNIEREKEIRRSILRREGVTKINQLLFTIDPDLKTAYVQYSVETPYGTSIGRLPTTVENKEPL